MNTNSLTWDSPLTSLSSRKPSKNLLKLAEGGFPTIKDLIWVLPLRIQETPKVQAFNHIEIDKLFLAKAKVISSKVSPAFGRRGKGRVQLFNANIIVQDLLSSEITTLKWFNVYPNFKKKMEDIGEFFFLGQASEYKGQIQFVNPQINPIQTSEEDGLLIEYPTVNTVPGKQIKSFIEKIPNTLWQTEISSYTSQFQSVLNLDSLNKIFMDYHGLGQLPNKDQKNRLIYEEFFTNQIKMFARKMKYKALKAPILEITESSFKKYLEIFPYELTADQIDVLKHIKSDFKSGHPMMRMIQGDVGCGKTSVAIIAALFCIEHNSQAALMCPTETLALQHLKTLQGLLKDKIRIEILLGSTKAKDKKIIYEKLKAGEIDLIVGTHSLFQDAVEFNDLKLAIIDEQHKFGVEQRQKLISKGKGVHTLIMTATPIPRTLQLAQYGDLEISTIKTMPSGRKGTSTRIVKADTYEKYLSFIQTRLQMNEQIYIVVPAIEESETLNINNVKNISEEYKKYFPSFKIESLHGQLKNDEKAQIMSKFEAGNINILVSTTVIEVGINVLNSTVISIYNPDRFGLSSLHQLRGRVGRGEKPGFCFLITDENTSEEAVKRLEVIEKSSDGFEIAEADLKNRGQGELFGSSQSGHASEYKFGNIFEHFDIFEKASKDINILKEKETEKLNNLIYELTMDKKVSSTI